MASNIDYLLTGKKEKRNKFGGDNSKLLTTVKGNKTAQAEKSPAPEDLSRRNLQERHARMLTLERTYKETNKQKEDSYSQALRLSLSGPKDATKSGVAETVRDFNSMYNLGMLSTTNKSLMNRSQLEELLENQKAKTDEAKQKEDEFKSYTEEQKQELRDEAATARGVANRLSYIAENGLPYVVSGGRLAKINDEYWDNGFVDDRSIEKMTERGWEYSDNAEDKEEYDRLLYDTIYGTGAFDTRLAAEDYDDNTFGEEIESLWDALESKKLYDYANKARKEADDKEFASTGDFGYNKYYEAQKSAEKALANLTDIEQWQMHAPTAASGEYNPDAVKAGKARTYGWVGLIYGDQTDVHGNETDEIYYFANNLPTGDMSELEQYNSLKAAMMMSDKQRDTFNRYYNHGMYKEAQAYYDALKPYLNAALTTTKAMYEKDMSTNENAWNMIIRRVFTGPAAGVAGAIGTVAALFGDKTAKDPNSEYWQPTATNASIVAARAAQYGEVFANVFGENGRKYGELIGNALYSIADNVVATVLTAGTGAAIGKTMADKFSRGMLQFVMSTEATAGAMKERLDNGQDPTQAALFALGSGVVEAITEKYSIDTLFNMDFKGLLRDKSRFLSYVGKNFFVEGTEEVAADLLNNVWDGAVSLFTDSTPEMMQEYEALASQYGPEEARRMVIDNFKEKLFDSFLAGGFSGLIMSSGYAGINASVEYAQNQEIGKNVREYNAPTNGTQEEMSRQETENIRRLITTAGRMQQTSQSKQRADALQGKINAGEKISNNEIGSLVRDIVDESGEQVGSVVTDVLKNEVRKVLEKNGASKGNAKKWSDFVTRTVLTSKAKMEDIMKTDAGQATRELMKDLLGKSGATAGMNEKTATQLAELATVMSLDLGIGPRTAADIMSHVSVRDTMLSFAKDTDLSKIAADAATDIRENLKIQRDVVEIMSGDARKAAGNVAKVTGDAKVAAKVDWMLLPGAQNRTAQSVVHDGKIIDIAGIKTEIKTILDEETGKEKKQSIAYGVTPDGTKVDLADVQAIELSMAKMLRYSQIKTNRQISDEAMSVLVQNAGKIRDVDSAIADAAKVAINTILERKTGNTRLGAELQGQVEAATLKAFEAEEKKRIANRRYIKPGQGIAVFGNDRFGTEAFKKAIEEKVKDKRIREEAYFVAELAKNAGFDVELKYDPEDDGNYGNFSGKNGITINLAATRANGSHQNALSIFSHEVTHWLEANSPEAYKALRKFVVERLESQGVNVASRLQDIVNNWRMNGAEDVDLNGAVAEMVANGSDQILTNEKVVEELRGSDPSLFGKIKEAVKDLLERFRDAIARMSGSTTYESRNMAPFMDRLGELWLGAFREAKGTTGTATAETQTQNSFREDLDRQYEEAVNRKDWRTAENMLLEKMQQTAGITGYRAPNFYNGEHANIAKMIKENYGDAVARAVEDMAPMVPENAVLIPMPPHEGKVLEDTDTMILAKALGEATGMPVVVALESDPHTSRNLAKKTGDRTVTADSMGFRQIADIPEGSMPVFVDNMVGGGTTATAAKNAIGRGITLAYAQSARAKSLGVKDVSVTYDSNGKLIPLSQRMDPTNKSYKYSMRENNEAYTQAVEKGDMKTAQRMVDEAANEAMPDTEARYDDGTLVPVYHGTRADFNVFDTKVAGGAHGTAEGYGIYLTDRKEISEKYGDRQIAGYLNVKRLANGDKVTIKKGELVKLIKETCEQQARQMAEDDPEYSYNNALRDTWISNYVYTPDYRSMNEAYKAVADIILKQESNDNNIIREVMGGMGIRDYESAMDFYHNMLTPITGIDGMWTEWKNYEGEVVGNIFLAFDSSQIKSSDPVTYDDQGNVIPLSERFNPESKDIRYSVRELDDHTRYVRVDTDQDIFDGHAESEYKTIAKKYIIDHFKGTTVGTKENAAYVDRKTADHYAFPAKTRGENIKKLLPLKMKAATELDNMMKASEYKGNSGYDDEHPEFPGGFDQHDVIFVFNEDDPQKIVVFKGTVQVGLDNLYRRHFYDLTKLKIADPARWVNQQKTANAQRTEQRSTDNIAPESQNFNTQDGKEAAYNREMDEAAHPASVQFSVKQLAEANGLRFDENELKLYDGYGKEIDGVVNKVTVEMIENTPAGRLINMARDGYKAKGAKTEKFRPQISAETALKQKQMLADLSNMIAQYKGSNLVWEIAGSLLYSAMKDNSDTQYTTTVDFGTICSKTQEIINVMSDVMLKRGRGLTREEVLEVYNQTAKAGLTVPCPVCYVFSRWMGVPSLLNQMNEYQKRFVKMNPDGSVNQTATQAAVTRYLNSAMKEYGNKKNLDKAKTALLNQLKTREDTRAESLAIMMSKTATAEEKRKAKERHDKAIKEADELTKKLGKIEAYNWVTQALCKETKKGSGKYIVDPEFVPTPESVLFDLRKTGEFAAKYTKNWKYRNTRGAGMGKAIMPYSGESLGDVIYGTERKSADMNAFFKYNAGKASTAIKNAIRRARAQNLLGGQRLQSTSDYRPEWGLDYIMTFLELQAIGSKVQMYTKVPEAVDLLASMGADVNLSIMGAGSGYHIATEDEIRRARTDKELRSRMGRTFDEEGVEHTYVLDFSDVTGMDYKTAKALKNKHNSVQMILVGMDDVHIRLAMANKDIDFIIPWHASGNSKDVLSSMMKSVGQQLDASHNYEDTQRDVASANQTAQQKKLWDIRVKILTGEELTAQEKRIIEKDDWLLDLYGRFNTKGIDEDCYKVKLGKAQAEQIFPYEYWDKSLKKADADKNGQRFVEYCEHFGWVPRFVQFADEKGYWKILIDRPMYDNDGNYREQQVVDVTKAKIGRMENRKLVDSDMPLKTSAMYGPDYSEEEKNATDNTLAALEERDRLRALGSDVLEEEAPAARNNQSAFAASSRQPVIEQTVTQTKEEIQPKKQRAMYVDEQNSFREEVDYNVKQWLDSIKVDSLRSEVEKQLVSSYRDLEISIRLDMERERNLEKQIAEIERTPEDQRSAEQQRMLKRLNIRKENVEHSMAAKQKKMAAITGQKGFGKLMQEQNRIFNDNVYGRTQAEVNKIVYGMEETARRIQERVEAAKAEVEELEKDNTIQKIKKILGATTADMAVDQLKKRFNSYWTKNELRTFFDPILVKMNAGEDFSNEVQELADVLVRSNQELVYEGLSALQGLTITIGRGQKQELEGKNSSLNEIRDRLAGTGIKVKYGKYNSLEGDVEDLRTEFPGMPELGDEKDSLENFISWVEGMKTQFGVDEYYSDYLAEAMAAVMETAARTASDSGLYVPKDTKARQQITDLVNYIRSLKTRTETAEKSLMAISDLMREIRESGERAAGMSTMMANNMSEALKYYDTVAKLAMEEAKKQKQSTIIEQLKSEHAQKILKINEEWRNLLQRSEDAHKQAEDNRAERGKINTAVKRMYHLLKDQTTAKNMPEYMKPLARYVIRQFVENDALEEGRKLTKADKHQLAEAMRLLQAWDAQDGPAEYNQIIEGLRESQEAVELFVTNDLTEIVEGIAQYNSEIRGKNKLDTLQQRGKILKRISAAVGEIYDVVQAERETLASGRKVKTESQAAKVRQGTGGIKFRERTGKIGRAAAAMHKAIVSGNMTPEYFFRTIGNEGLNDLWENYHQAENRNGLELAKAKERLKKIADKHGYGSWDMQEKVTVKLGGKNIEMTLGQLMSLYATWKREQQLGPAMSEHLTTGGFFVEKDLRDGILGKEVMEKRAHRISSEGDVTDDGQLPAVENALTKEQKDFVDDVVSYMSNEMSELGNEASMIAYGIKLYKEKYYFPFQIWDGVKSRKSNDAGQGANVDRAFHPSFAKSRLHGANNALIMGDFMQTAADHIAGMINYATMGLANESLQKVLNYQLEEGGETPDGYDIYDVTKRNIRAVLEEAYGQEAMQYLAELQKQLNGGAVKVEKSFYDKLISLFRKNAVAGSLSVAAQQPLSYIRAAVLIDSKYLAAALNPKYWKNSYKEMLEHSGVAVIKDMGRFDMNFGQSAREYLQPEGKETKLQKAWGQVTEKATILPELADRATWTRMWSAVKLEQHAEHPEMDIRSDEFLDLCGKRFNEVMRRTQVYDSVLVKSANMRNQTTGMKLLTSFMAEPTLSLNVLADAVRSARSGEAGGKALLAKAGATFLMSAVLQAAVKALMSAGRTPDDKKTQFENWMYRFGSNVISEVDPLQLLPGYNEILSVFKNGKVNDDAMGALGKLYTSGKDTVSLLLGNGWEDPYKAIENSVGQLTQIITDLPVKNIMRDLRASYNLLTGGQYAKRENNASVIDKQFWESFFNADNAIGLLNDALGDAGYKVTNTAYYKRIYEAQKAGDEEKAQSIIDYLIYGKGVKEKTIKTGVNKAKKEAEAGAEEEE